MIGMNNRQRSIALAQMNTEMCHMWGDNNHFACRCFTLAIHYASMLRRGFKTFFLKGLVLKFWGVFFPKLYCYHMQYNSMLLLNVKAITERQLLFMERSDLDYPWSLLWFWENTSRAVFSAIDGWSSEVTKLLLLPWIAHGAKMSKLLFTPLNLPLRCGISKWAGELGLIPFSFACSEIPYTDKLSF